MAAVVEAAFQGPTEAALVERVRSSAGHRPELTLVAVLDGQVVGHVMVSAASLVEDDGRVHPVISLAPLAVEPAHHGQGIGGALVREALVRADGAREPLVLLEGDPAYYARFGFEDARRHGIRFTLPDWAPPEAGQILRLTGYDPAVRGRVEYPPAFDEVLEHDDHAPPPTI